VRQELRAIVGARTQRVPNNLQNNLSGQVSQDDLEALGLSFEMTSAGTSHCDVTSHCNVLNNQPHIGTVNNQTHTGMPNCQTHTDVLTKFVLTCQITKFTLVYQITKLTSVC